MTDPIEPPDPESAGPAYDVAAAYQVRQASLAVTNALWSERQAQYALQQAQDSASRSLDLTTARD